MLEQVVIEPIAPEDFEDISKSWNRNDIKTWSPEKNNFGEIINPISQEIGNNSRNEAYLDLISKMLKNSNYHEFLAPNSTKDPRKWPAVTGRYARQKRSKLEAFVEKVITPSDRTTTLIVRIRPNGEYVEQRPAIDFTEHEGKIVSYNLWIPKEHLSIVKHNFEENRLFYTKAMLRKEKN